MPEVGEGRGEGLESPHGRGVRRQPVPIVLDVFEPAGRQETVLDGTAAVGAGGHGRTPFTHDPFTGLDQFGRGRFHPRPVAGHAPVVCHEPHDIPVALVIAARLVAAVAVEQPVGAVEIAGSGTVPW